MKLKPTSQKRVQADKEIMVTFIMKADIEDPGMFGLALMENLENAFNRRIYNSSWRELDKRPLIEKKGKQK